MSGIKPVEMIWALLLLAARINAQCTDSHGCFCFSGYVTCSGLRQFPSWFPTDTAMITITDMAADEIPANVLNSLPHLKNFEIHASNITRISSASFAGLSNMELISLNTLRIGTIEQGAFFNLTNIGVLTIYSSYIDNIESYAFLNMFALDELSLFSTEIQTVAPFAFHEISEVFKFRLTNNKVTSMKPYALSEITDVYSFEMFLNSFGSLGCNSVDKVIEGAYESSFYSNSVQCSCKLSWAINNPSIREQMFLNWCEMPDSSEQIYWNLIARETLLCHVDEDEDCPSLLVQEFPVATSAEITVITTPTSSDFKEFTSDNFDQQFTTAAIVNNASKLDERAMGQNLNNTHIVDQIVVTSTSVSKDYTEIDTADRMFSDGNTDVGNAEIDTQETNAVKMTHVRLVPSEPRIRHHNKDRHSKHRTGSLVSDDLRRNQTTNVNVTGSTNTSELSEGQKEIIISTEQKQSTQSTHTRHGGFYVVVSADKMTYEHSDNSARCTARVSEILIVVVIILFSFHM